MSSELVERMRESAEHLQEYVAEVGPWPSVYKHCAARIEALEAENMELKRDRDFWKETFQGETRARIELANELAELKTDRVFARRAREGGNADGQ